MDRKRILIVEDELRVAHALGRALTLAEGGGYRVESCRTGEAAIERLRGTHFDLLVADLRMPGMSGLELLEQLRQIAPTTRSILITAFGSPQVEESARRLANTYLPKPFSTEDFVKAVRETLRLTPATPYKLVAFSESGLNAIQQAVETLRVDLGASCAWLLDQSGRLLTECGQHGEFDLNAFLALLGNAMVASNEVVHMLRDEASFDLHIHEGKNFQIYSVRISDLVFLTLILDRQSSTSRVGMVWLTLRRAVTELRGLVDNAMIVSGALGDQELATAVDQAMDEMFDRAEKPASPAGKSVQASSIEKDEPTVEESSADLTQAPGAVLSYDQARALGLIDLDGETPAE